jgi:hypothetical protein
MMTKLELYQQMKSELLARKNPLLAEKEQLQKAATRLNAIGHALAAIDEEIAEYDAAIAPLLPTQVLPAPEAPHSKEVVHEEG